MVKGYDPTQTDPAAILLDRFASLFTSPHLISLPEAQKHVFHWLSHSSYTANIYRSFRDISMRPTVKLVKKCNLSKGTFKDIADEYFPSSSSENEIRVCLNNVRNKVELKEHLDRQMTFLYLQNKQSEQQDEERKLMSNVYESCAAGYRNYLLDKKVERELNINCSKYLFFRKSQKQLPIDRLFRYTTKLSEEMF